MFSLPRFHARHRFVKLSYGLGLTALLSLVLLATASAQTQPPATSPETAPASSNETVITEYSPPTAIAAKAEIGMRCILTSSSEPSTAFSFCSPSCTGDWARNIVIGLRDCLHAALCRF